MSDVTVDGMLQLWESGKYDDCRIRSMISNADMHGWDIEEEGDWTQDYKYQHIARIIKHLESGRCFELNISRSGSYHTDWYYTYDNDPVEVKRVVETIKVTKWVAA